MNRSARVVPPVLGLFLVFSLSSAALGQPTCSVPCPAPSLSSPPPAATPPAAIAPGPETRLAEIDAEVDHASARGDRDGVARHLDDGMIAIDIYSGSIQTRQELLKQISPRSPSSQIKTTESEVVVKILGETGIVTSRKTDSWVSDGRPESRSYHESNTYARRGDTWKMLVSLHTEEPPPYSPKDVAFDVAFDPSEALGDPKAPVVIYEFGDYECEMCRMFARNTMGRIEKEYVRTGKAAVVFRDFPLAVHKRAFAAAAAARCASDAGKRWPMGERLLKDPVALSDEDLRSAAREVGLSSAPFAKCVSDPATAQKIRQGMSEARDFGVSGTPMFLVGVHRPGEAKVRGIRMIEGAVPFEVFQATLDGLLRVASP